MSPLIWWGNIVVVFIMAFAMYVQHDTLKAALQRANDAEAVIAVVQSLGERETAAVAGAMKLLDLPRKK